MVRYDSVSVDGDLKRVGTVFINPADDVYLTSSEARAMAADLTEAAVRLEQVQS